VVTKSNSKEETGHAVQVAARLDHLLLMLILTHLDNPNISKGCAKKTFDTFYERRTFARDHGLISKATDEALKLVNDMRKVFAHAEEPITFRNRHVVKVAGKQARRRFDAAARRAEHAIEKRRNRIVFKQSR
jgi:hypothetical protein